MIATRWSFPVHRPAAVRRVSIPLALAAILAAGCSRPEASAPPPPPPPSVTATPVEKAPVAGSKEYVGRTESVSFVDLRARVGGFLMQRNFVEGGDVKEGDLLYLIEQAPYEAAVDAAAGAVAQAEATLDNAEKYLKRLEAVEETGGTSKAEIDAAEKTLQETRAILAQRRAQLTRAQLDLGYTEIRAPIGGRIGRTAVHAGNLVGPESGILATIVKLDPIWVSFPISERDYLTLQGQAAGNLKAGGAAPRLVPTIRLVDGSAYPHRGTIDFQDNRLDRATGTLMVRATFPNPQLLLRPGQFVTVVQTEGRTLDRLVIPQAAVQRDQVGPFVMIVSPEGKAEVRRIRLGDEFGARWIVLEGLEEGDMVISEGLQKVSPGAPVRVSGAAPVQGAEGRPDAQ